MIEKEEERLAEVEIDRQVDVVFKEIFGDPEILARFLTDILGVEITPQELIYIQTEITPEYYRDKVINMDIQVTSSKTHDRMNIEMQIRNQGDTKKRMTYYLSRAFVSDLKKSEDYDQLTRQIVILIVNFNLIEYTDSNKAYGVFQLRERDTGVLFTDEIELHVLELKKIKNLDSAEKVKNPIFRWMTYLNNEKGNAMQQIAQQEPMIQKAMLAERVFFTDDDKKRAYERSLRIIRDWDYGLKISKKEGIEKGIEEGIEKGIEKRNYQIAMNMLAKNMDLNTIADIIGLSLDEIKKL